MARPGVRIGINNGKMGRPITEIDEKTWKEIENYLACGATKMTIVDLLNRRGFKISKCTLERRIKEKFGFTFDTLKTHNLDMMRLSVRSKLYQEALKGGKTGVDAGKHLDKFLNKTIEAKDERALELKRMELELKQKEFEFQKLKHEQQQQLSGAIAHLDDDTLALLMGALEVERKPLEKYAQEKEKPKEDE